MKKNITSVSPEKAFWFCNGQVARNLKDFAAILEKMPQNVFNYHANVNKNDFSRWVADVFGEATLAKAIQKMKSPLDVAKKVKSKL